MRATAWRLGLAAAVLAGTVASLAITRSQEPTSQAGPPGIRHVVIFAVPGLGLDDVGSPTMPRLTRLADRGAIAAANVRTLGDQPDLAEAYGSLGAGNRIGGGETPVAAYGADESINGIRAGDRLVGEATAPAEDGIVVPAIDLIRTERQPSGGSGVAALGDALHGAGRTTAVIANEDQPTPDGGQGRNTPASLSVVDHNGRIDGGQVSENLLKADPVAPSGLTVDGDAFVAAVRDAVRVTDVVVVDPGETVREAGVPLDPADGDRSAWREHALATTDALIGRVEAALPADALLLVVGVTPPGERWALTPVVAVGDRVPAGYLDSPSTQRPGLVTLTDLAPTVLDALGVPPDDAMIGRPLRYRPGPASFDDAGKLDDLLRRRDPVDHPMIGVFVALQAALYVVAIGLLIRSRGPGRFARILELAVLACAAWPLATFVLRLSTGLYSLGYGTVALAWLLAIGIAAGAQRLRSHPLDPVLAICGATVAILVVDLATGAHLQVASFFGYTPHTAPRYRGVGNASFALLGGCTIVIATSLVARARNLAAARAGATAVAVAVVLADGAPWMGADVGGILALVPVLALTLWSLHGHRIRWRTLGAAAAVTVAVLAVVVGFESQLDPSGRSHIGRFFLNADDGPLVWNTLRRKWDLNMRILREALWSWLVPVLAGCSAYLLVVRRRWQRYLPLGSPVRTGVLATLAMGTVGWLLNDSGVMVLALTTIYLGPYILLQALRGPNRLGTEASEPRSEARAPVGSAPADSVPHPMAADDHRDHGLPAHPTVVAIVPAFDRADSVAATVRALAAIESVARVVVVDDGSADDTSEAARRAGAEVLRLPVNRGKGAAVKAGIAATPEADVYLFIDADLADTAATAAALLEPVLAGAADLTVGVLPPAAGRGGFGTVRTFAARGILRACGARVRAPLSGQRAVRADLVRELASAERFGLEVAMTIDVVRAGGRLVELEVPMDHRHTGRSVSGFAHRGRQGIDIAAALWPRLASGRLRRGLLALGLLAAIVASYFTAGWGRPATAPSGQDAGKVVIFGLTGVGIEDVNAESMPNLAALGRRGAMGMASPRTGGPRTPTAAYATIGAGDKVAAYSPADVALPPDAEIEGDPARDVLSRRMGVSVRGEVLVPAMPMAERLAGPTVNSAPGALGDALHAAGRTTAVVTNADTVSIEGDTDSSAPAALAVVDRLGSVDHGRVDGRLLHRQPDLPFGLGIDRARFLQAVAESVDRADVTMVDPGELARRSAYDIFTVEAQKAENRRETLRRTDDLLAAVALQLPDDTLLIVAGITPPVDGRLVPIVVDGPGVHGHRLTSPSTGRLDLVTLTDLAPTVLDALGLPVEPDMIGRPFEYGAGRPDHGDLVAQNDLIKARDKVYQDLVTTYVWLAMAVYAGALAVIWRRAGGDRGVAAARFAVLTLAAWPAATFLIRAATPLYDLGVLSHVLVWAAAAGLAAVASRWRADAMAALYVLAIGTFLLLAADLATGAHLQVSSYLGYTPSVGARFMGVGNAASGVLAGATVLACAMHVARSGRPRDARWTAAVTGLAALAVVGAPWIGSDVGGILSLGPALGVTLFLMTGRRVSWRTLVAIGGTTLLGLGAVVGIEALRSAPQRTHIGQFFLGSGHGHFLTTFERKWEVNSRLLTTSTWTLLIIAVGVFAICVLWPLRGWRRFLHRRVAERAAVVGLVTAALLGFLVNDSGTLSAALVMALLGPLVALAALRGDEPDPEWVTGPAPEQEVVGRGGEPVPGLAGDGADGRHPPVAIP
ncbi:MAG: hypothetical protein JWM47_881 [Acidimicrobiales bacterium]|nr:hypothetical protein [Acidimicrobiales bacterium]